MAQTEKSELIIPSDRVRDLSTAARRLPIQVEGSVTHELLLVVWSVFNSKPTGSAQDLGKAWVKEIQGKTSPGLAEELTTLGGPWQSAWLAISSLLLSAPRPHDPDRALAWLAAVDDNRFRRWFLWYHSDSEDEALIEQTAEGDEAAVATVVGDKADEYPEVLEHLRWVVTTHALPQRYAAALRRFRDEVFTDYEEEFGAAIARAAAARRATPTRGSAKDVIEEVTSGLEFEVPMTMNRVVLVPSVVTRPLSLIDGNRGTLVVYYAIADEFVGTDPEAPPSWLVRMYKALSDDKRLRILRRMAEGETTTDELTEMLGLSKSTVHHHIGLLRAAGLVRVRIPTDEHGKHRLLTLRPQALTDANDFLDSYLSTEGDHSNAR